MCETTLQTLLDRRSAFLAFVERRVSDPALAEDILQAAYMRALGAADNLRENDSAVAWFYSVLRNAVIDTYRRGASESKVLDRWASDLEVAEVAAPEASTRDFVCGCIAHVLPTLKPAYAEILQQVDLQEQSLADFARARNLTPGNAAVRAHRARAALRKELTRVCGACSIHACLDCCCKQPPERATSPVPPSPSR